MANRYFYQFNYSFERMVVSLMGSAAQSGSAGVFATKVTQGLTLTAVLMGSAGNSISIAFTTGGTAGAEVVSVSGNAISVQIQSGVSTVTQVRTAINASAAAAALVGVTGTSGSAVSAASALPLLTGADAVFTIVGMSSVALSQIGTGLYRLTLADPYPSMIGMSIMIGRSTAVDLKAQIKSAAPSASGGQIIDFFINAVATPTNLSSGDILYFDIKLRNSSQTP